MSSTNEHTDRNDVTELLYAIANAAQAECHWIELLMVNEDLLHDYPRVQLLDMLNIAAKHRSVRIKLMNQLVLVKPAARGIWCTIKHLTMTEMHNMELFSKTNNIVYLNIAKDIHMLLDKLLSIQELIDFQDCQRCETDADTERPSTTTLE